jgi:FMN phosphatase YigB (HAD superfamily)
MSDTAYVFDFDGTLAVTSARVFVMVGNTVVKTLLTTEYSSYELKGDERFEYMEFRDPRFIESAQETELIHFAKFIARLNHTIYILTARDKGCLEEIKSFLHRFNLIPKEIYCVGNGDANIPEAKQQILKQIIAEHETVFFYDDDDANLELATELKCHAKDAKSILKMRHQLR